MKFCNNAAYIGKVIDRPASHPETLIFEEYIGEISTKCTLDNMSVIKYINDNTVDENKVIEEIRKDLYNDYMEGIDVLSKNYGKINSKSCRSKDLKKGIIHIKKSDINHNIDYFSTIIFADNALYLVSKDDVMHYCNFNEDGFDIILGDFIKMAKYTFQLSKGIKYLYQKGFFKWTDRSLNTDEKIHEIESWFIEYNANNENYGGESIHKIQEIHFHYNDIATL